MGPIFVGYILMGTIFVEALQLDGDYICGGTSACWGLYLWGYFSLMEPIFVGLLQVDGNYICGGTSS